MVFIVKKALNFTKKIYFWSSSVELFFNNLVKFEIDRKSIFLTFFRYKMSILITQETADISHTAETFQNSIINIRSRNEISW